MAKIFILAVLYALAGAVIADEFVHTGVKDLSSDFTEATGDGKLYFVKVLFSILLYANDYVLAVLSNAVIALLQLYATWCGHCPQRSTSDLVSPQLSKAE